MRTAPFTGRFVAVQAKPKFHEDLFHVTYEDVLNAGYSRQEIARMSSQRMSFEEMLVLKEIEDSTEALLSAI